jgi:rubrerythrin
MNAADIARSMETDAVEFYAQAAEKTSHPIGKKMFLSIVEDEKRHVRMIDALIKGLGLTEDNIDPMEQIKSVFAENKDAMQERIAATNDDLEALKIAMEMEGKGRDFYRKAADEATDDISKALFERLFKEEEKHYAIFSNTYSFLSDTGNWYMWEEQGVIEG